MFNSEYAFDAFQQTQGASIRFSILVWKKSLNMLSIYSVYKHCACLFSLVRIGQSEVHIRACECGDLLIWNLANWYSAIMIARNWGLA